MNFIYYFLIISPALTGVLFFLNSNKTKLLQKNLLLNIGISLWITALFNLHLNNETLSALLLPIAHAITLTSFLLIAIVYPKPSTKLSALKLFCIFLPLIITTISIIPNTFITLNASSSTQVYLKLLDSIFCISYLVLATFILIKKIIKKTYQKNQKNLIYLTISALLLLILTKKHTYIVNVSFLTYLNQSITLALLSLSFLYIFIDNKLYKIKTISINTIPFLLSIIILTPSYILIFKLTEHYFNFSYTYFYYIQIGLYLSIILPLFNPLKTRFYYIFEKILFKNQYNYKKILYELSTQLNQIHSNKSLNKLLNTLFINKLDLKKAEIFIPNNYFNDSNISDSFTPFFNNTNTHQTHFTNKEIEFLSTHQTKPITTSKYLENFPEKKETFKNYALILSTFNEEKKLITITLLDNKLNQNPFNKYDDQLFITINEITYKTLDRIKNQRITSQINLAKRVQEELTPKNLSIKNCSSSTYFKSCNEVGGDFLDYHKRDNNEWIILGDVTGLGIGAGMVVLMIQSIFSTLIHSAKITEPNKLNDLANSILLKNFKRLQDPLPLTIACIHTTDGKHFSVHGTHEHLFIYTKKDHKIKNSPLNDIPIGLGLTESIEENYLNSKSINLNNGDILFITTDGLTEATKKGTLNNEEFSETRIKNIILENAQNSVDDIKNTLIQELNQFTKNQQKDDITFVLIKSEKK